MYDGTLQRQRNIFLKWKIISKVFLRFGVEVNIYVYRTLPQCLIFYHVCNSVMEHILNIVIVLL